MAGGAASGHPHHTITPPALIIDEERVTQLSSREQQSKGRDLSKILSVVYTAVPGLDVLHVDTHHHDNSHASFHTEMSPQIVEGEGGGSDEIIAELLMSNY